MLVLLGYIAVLLTLLAGVAGWSAWRHRRESAPIVTYVGEPADDSPGLVLDVEDTGVRQTIVEVASPLPLTVVSTSYTLDLPDAGLSLRDATHKQVVDALRQAEVDDATWSLTFWLPGMTLSPRRPQELFVLVNPLVRRFTALHADVLFSDPHGRTVTKRVSALSRQPMSRAVRADERVPA